MTGILTGVGLLLVIIAVYNGIQAQDPHIPDQPPSDNQSEILCNRTVDMVFVIDGSDSLFEEDFDKEKAFVKEVIERLYLNEVDGIVVGVIVFSSSISIHTDFDLSNKTSIFEKVDQLLQPSEGTKTFLAIKSLREELLLSGRPGAEKVGVVVTDGRSQNRTRTINEATLTKDSNITLAAVGVGAKIDGAELRGIASSTNLTYTTPDFNSLQNLSIDIIGLLCPELLPPTTTTTTTTTTTPRTTTTTRMQTPTTTTTESTSTTTTATPTPTTTITTTPTTTAPSLTTTTTTPMPTTTITTRTTKAPLVTSTTTTPTPTTTTTTTRTATAPLLTLTKKTPTPTTTTTTRPTPTTTKTTTLTPTKTTTRPSPITTTTPTTTATELTSTATTTTSTPTTTITTTRTTTAPLLTTTTTTPAPTTTATATRTATAPLLTLTKKTPTPTTTTTTRPTPTTTKTTTLTPTKTTTTPSPITTTTPTTTTPTVTATVPETMKPTTYLTTPTTTTATSPPPTTRTTTTTTTTLPPTTTLSRTITTPTPRTTPTETTEITTQVLTTSTTTPPSTTTTSTAKTDIPELTTYSATAMPTTMTATSPTLTKTTTTTKTATLSSTITPPPTSTTPRTTTTPTATTTTTTAMPPSSTATRNPTVTTTTPTTSLPTTIVTPTSTSTPTPTTTTPTPKSTIPAVLPTRSVPATPTPTMTTTTPTATTATTSTPTASTAATTTAPTPTTTATSTPTTTTAMLTPTTTPSPTTATTTTSTPIPTTSKIQKPTTTSSTQITRTTPTLTTTTTAPLVRTTVSTTQTPGTTTMMPSTTTTTRTPTTRTPITRTITPCYDGCRFDGNLIGYMPHELNCTQFYHCQMTLNGQIDSTLKSCPSGLFWNQQILACDFPKNVRCPVDPCLDNEIGYYLDANCNAFWECDGDRTSYQRCCPLAMSFNLRTLRCDSSFCPETCIQEIDKQDIFVQRCTKFALFDDPNTYMERLDSYPYSIKRKCPPTLGFNNFTCLCDVALKTTPPPPPKCSAELYLPLDRDFKDASGRNVFVQVNGVVIANVNVPANTVGGGAALFDGRGFLSIPSYANAFLGSTLKITFRYYPLKPADNIDNRQEALITNSGCNNSATVAIAYDRLEEGTYCAIDTSGKGNSGSLLPAQSATNRWRNVSYIYNGKSLQLEVNGDVDVSPAFGIITSTKSALKIGAQCARFKGFTGYIDEVRIFRCLD